MDLYEKIGQEWVQEKVLKINVALFLHQFRLITFL